MFQLSVCHTESKHRISLKCMTIVGNNYTFVPFLLIFFIFKLDSHVFSKNSGCLFVVKTLEFDDMVLFLQK